PELTNGLTDKFAPLRQSTIGKLEASKMAEDAKVLEAIEKIANTDKDRKTKAAAISYLAKTSNAKYRAIYDKNINDSSYSVAGASLEGIIGLEPAKAYELAKKYSKDAKGTLGDVVNEVIIRDGTEADFDFIADRYDQMPLSQEKLTATATFSGYLEKVQNMTNVKKGIDLIIKFRNKVPEQFRSFVDPMFKSGLNKLGKAKGKEIEDYIEQGFK
ncbi:MAG: hypothetical protein WBO39_11785, partial [Ferruginibacter sp.]